MSEQLTIQSSYKPGSEKAVLFHKSPAFFKDISGGYGSGKTRMVVEEVSLLLSEFPGIVIYVMRKTMPALRDSTLHEFLKYMDPNLGTYNKKTEQFNCVNGSECRFRGLDDPMKQKGPEPAVVVWDEADEFTREDFMIMKARIRQRVKVGVNSKPYPLHFILVHNPVDEGQHWLDIEFVVNSKLYDLEGGLLHLELSTYDNLANLPPGYIEKTTIGMSKDEIDRYIHGKAGSVVRGKAIYGDVFSADLHLKKWQYESHLLLVRGWDFGFNRPACVFRLKDPLGRKNIDFEMLGEKENIDIFGRKVVAATALRYGKILKVFDYCDPRGFDKSDKGQSSVDCLNDLGIFPTGERGIRAYVEPGIKAVRRELSTLIQGQPELTINPECALIRAAYSGKYVRGDDGDPKKDGYYEHLCDADRYSAYMDRTSNAVQDAMANRQVRMATRSFNKVTGYGR